MTKNIVIGITTVDCVEYAKHKNIDSPMYITGPINNTVRSVVKQTDSKIYYTENYVLNGYPNGVIEEQKKEKSSIIITLNGEETEAIGFSIMVTNESSVLPIGKDGFGTQLLITCSQNNFFPTSMIIEELHIVDGKISIKGAELVY